MIPPPVKRLVLCGILVLAAAGPASAVVQVDVSVDSGGPSTRVILTQSEAVSWIVSGGEDRVEIVYGRPIEVRPERGDVGDGILEGWERSGDVRIVFRTGPDFREVERFELRNPSRLVLDFRGEREGSVPERPAGPEVLDTSVIVLDPGHGGVENGAIGPTGLMEKHVALDLARRLARVLERERGLTVVLTRDDDRIVPLDERTAIANHNRAELFVSIHLNSSPRTSAYGAETYYLSADATDDEARTLAALENRAYEKAGSARPVRGAAADPGLELILWDLAQNRFLAESSTLAETVQRELNALTGTRDRGVRQAPFTVLMGATMPAVLVEVGFISNGEEEERFRDPDYKDRVVEAIARAIRQFRRDQQVLDGAAVPEGRTP